MTIPRTDTYVASTLQNIYMREFLDIAMVVSMSPNRIGAPVGVLMIIPEFDTYNCSCEKCHRRCQQSVTTGPDSGRCKWGTQPSRSAFIRVAIHAEEESINHSWRRIDIVEWQHSAMWARILLRQHYAWQHFNTKKHHDDVSQHCLTAISYHENKNFESITLTTSTSCKFEIDHPQHPRNGIEDELSKS